MISEFHLRGWNRIPEVVIVALCNRTLSRAEDRRASFAPRAHTYDDFGAMLARERLDFVDILTVPSLHRTHCLMARDAGLHVICQKPLCDTLEDARLLVREMHESPKLFAVHENHRYRPWFRDAASRHRQGEFGKLAFARFEHLNATEPAEAYNETGTGILLEYGSHLMDMMRCLLGEPLRVYARTHRLNPRVHGESLVHATYEYPDATAVIEVAWKPAALTQGSFLAVGDAGEAWYEGTMTRGKTSRFRVTHGTEVVLDEPRNPYDDYVESFYLFERELANAMTGRASPTQTGPAQSGAENLRTLICTFAAYESARRGGIVEIEKEVG